MWVFQRNLSLLRMLLFGIETVLIMSMLLIIGAADFVYHEGMHNYWLFDARQFFLKSFVIVVVCQGSMYLNELYDSRIARRRRELVT